MPFSLSTRWQTIVVAILFVASLSVLTFTSLSAFLLPRAEQRARQKLVEAARRVAGAIDERGESVSSNATLMPDSEHERLSQVLSTVLNDFPGVEGGIYLANGRDQFVGYAFPTEPEKHRNRSRREPPPLETPYIRLQAQRSLASSPGEVSVQSLDVGPSRVVVATTPIGTARPSAAVVWLMDRISGPAQQAAQFRRFQLSTLLALAGMAVALVLTISVGRNLRRERAAQETLRDNLRRSEHLASLGMMLARVAHEVRNPLAAIRSTVQLWERLPDEARTPASLDSVVQAVGRLNLLVGRLLQFARADNSAHTSLQLNSLVTDIAELLRATAAEQKIEITTELRDVPAVAGSAQGLQQVILNLATNALQAMPTGGRLEFGTQFDARRKTVQLEVADTGMGLAPEVQRRLFEPFFTTRADGTGLGLALCREIVLQHGGQMTLEPRDPRGTRCLVSLPQAES